MLKMFWQPGEAKRGDENVSVHTPLMRTDDECFGNQVI
jgi:hypothetical protein